MGGLSACAEAQAARSAFRAGETVVVAAGETIDGDLYATGGSVTVNGTVRGDVYAGAGNVVVNGRVGGDLVAGAGQVTIGGPVDGSVIVGAGQLTVSGPIARDLVVGAGQVTVSERIGGDLRAGAGALFVSGRVGEDVVAGSGVLELARGSEVGGDLVLDGGRASVAGAVRGSILGRAESYQRSGTVGGREQVTITPREAGPVQGPTDRFAERARLLVTLALLGLLLLWVAPGTVRVPARRVRQDPLRSLGWGVLAWVGFVFGLVLFTVAWVLLAIGLGVATLGGLVAAVVTSGLLIDAAGVLALVLSAAFLAWIVVGLALGELALARLTPAREQNAFIAFLVGIVVLVIVASLPVLDVLVTIAVLLAGVGVLGWSAYDALRAPRLADTEPAPPPVTG